MLKKIGWPSSGQPIDKKEIETLTTFDVNIAIIRCLIDTIRWNLQIGYGNTVMY